MHRLFSPACLCLLLLATVLPTQAQADPVDDFITTRMRQQHIPGLSLAVVRDGKILKIKGYGLADRERHTAAKPETVYDLASVTTQFTAAAIMLLVEDGKIQLDAKTPRYLEGLPEAWSSITVRNLLTMTSGLKDYLKTPGAKSEES